MMMVGTLPLSLVELRCTGSLCPPYISRRNGRPRSAARRHPTHFVIPGRTVRCEPGIHCAARMPVEMDSGFSPAGCPGTTIKSPLIAHDAFAGVTLGDVREFALERRGGRPAVLPAHLDGRGGECRVGSLCG